MIPDEIFFSIFFKGNLLLALRFAGNLMKHLVLVNPPWLSEKKVLNISNLCCQVIFRSLPRNR